jgi:dipeptidyl aminopeptidase/acylaminoacyl peptidase
MPRLIACCLAALVVISPADAARPMTIDDLFAFKRVADPQISPDGKWVVYQVGTVDLAANKTTTNLWIAASEGKSPPKQLTASTKADRHPRWSPDGTKILFESTRSGDSQLWVIDLTGGEAKQLTHISTGANTAIWSPDGKSIAFVSAVYPEFSELAFAESDKKNKEKADAEEKNPVKAKVFKQLFFRHWDEWIEDKRQHLFVMSGDGGEPRNVTPGDRDAYPTSTTFSVGDDFVFSPDSTHLIFTAVPARDAPWSTNYDICRVSVTNKSKDWETLTKDNPAADGSPRFSPDGKKLAYRAQKRAGYEADCWHVCVVDCDPAGGSWSNYFDNLFRSDGPPSVDELVWRHDRIMFTYDVSGFKRIGDVGTGKGPPAFSATPIDVASPSTGARSSLSVSRDGRWTAFVVAALDRPNEVYVEDHRSTTGPVLVSHANDALLAELDRPRPEAIDVPVEGNVKMQMWILKPPGFDEKKKYPVAYLVHGGPQGAWEDGWSYRWNPELWAARGYVVVLPNPRGSTGFGQKFTEEISGDWGGKCYRDLIAGLDYVEKLPYVDKERMAAAGASFGGYMMDWFAVNEISKRFKCIISHEGVWDFDSMWGTTDELWFDEYEHGGLPWEVPGKYAEFSPHKKAANLGKYKTPMLVIQNDLDFRCPVGQGLELFTALQRQHVPSKMINFPNEGHWVLKPKNSEFWHKEVFAWLTKYCPPGGK